MREFLYRMKALCYYFTVLWIICLMKPDELLFSLGDYVASHSVWHFRVSKVTCHGWKNTVVTDEAWTTAGNRRFNHYLFFHALPSLCLLNMHISRSQPLITNIHQNYIWTVLEDVLPPNSWIVFRLAWLVKAAFSRTAHQSSKCLTEGRILCRLTWGRRGSRGSLTVLGIWDFPLQKKHSSFNLSCQDNWMIVMISKNIAEQEL